MKKLYIFLLAICLLCSGNSFATVFTVNSLAATNTGSGTSGTLRYCIDQANQSPGPHTINFNVAGTITINTYANLLPDLLQAITIDGTTAPGFSGAPVVILKGTIGSSGYWGIQISAANCSIYGLEVNGFPYWGITVTADSADNYIIGASGKGNVVRGNGYWGIYIDSADNGVISHNKIGTDYNGTVNGGNSYDGIRFEDFSTGNIISGNQISFNKYRGIEMYNGCSSNQITDNFIGTNPTATANQGNLYDGISLENGSNSNFIGCNYSSCNHYSGINVNASNNNVMQGNVLGSLSTTCSGNLYSGIWFMGGASNNLVGGSVAGQSNKIAGNDYWGVSSSGATTMNNILTGNSYLCNTRIGIINITGASNNITAPVIGLASSTTVSGTSLPDAIIEIFKSQKSSSVLCASTPAEQGTDYIGTVTADGAGNWSMNGSFNGWITTTQRDGAGNTSAFTVPVYSGVAGTLVNNCSSSSTGVCGVSPIAGFLSSDDNICTNDCINFTDVTSGAPTGWLWIFAGATPSSSTSQNPQNICYFNTGNFTVALTASNSGGSNTITMTNHITVVAAPPTPNITVSNDTLYCSYDPSYTSYQWYDINGPISGATNSWYVTTTGGNYNVQVSNENGCSTAVGIVLGTKSFNVSGLEFSLAPNPVSDKLFITGNYKLNTGNNTLTIFNVIGEMILSNRLSFGAGQKESVDISMISPGAYFVHVATESGKWVGRFVKE